MFDAARTVGKQGLLPGKQALRRHQQSVCRAPAFTRRRLGTNIALQARA
jgi:hypothetical protein